MTVPTDARIRPEQPDDAAAVRAVHLAAFADEPVVADLVAPLRARSAPLPPVGLVAEVDGDVVGHVLLSHAWLDARDRLVDIHLLSPLGVHPGAQGRGIGSALVRAGLAASQGLAVPLVVLEGAPGYYGRLGFVAGSTLGLRRPSLRIPGPAFQAVPGAAFEPSMAGTVVYPEIFWALDAVGLRDPLLGQIEAAHSGPGDPV